MNLNKITEEKTDNTGIMVSTLITVQPTDCSIAAEKNAAIGVIVRIMKSFLAWVFARLSVV